MRFKVAAIILFCILFACRKTKSSGSGLGAVTVTWQANPSHDGNVQDPDIHFPLKPIWSLRAEGLVTYPLVAENKVFLSISPQGPDPCRIQALDAKTGAVVWGPVSVGSGVWAHMAYDEGVLYVASYDGTVAALASATGKELWKKSIAQSVVVPLVPIALDGEVILSNGKGVAAYALKKDGSNSRSMSCSFEGEVSSPPTFGDGLVFSSFECTGLCAEPFSGGAAWQKDVSCDRKLAGAAPVYHEGRVYFRSGVSGERNAVFDAVTGEQKGTFPADRAPAFSGKMLYALSNNILQAVDIETSTVRWRFSGASSMLTTSALVVNDTVLVGSTDGKLFALNAETGKLIWNDRAAASLSASQEFVGSPYLGIAAGQGVVVGAGYASINGGEGSEITVFASDTIAASDAGTPDGGE